jgi:hypothetical protein
MATATTAAITTTPPGSKAAAAPPPPPPPAVPDAVQELLQKHSLLWCVQARKAFVVQPQTTPPEAMPPPSPSSSSSSSPTTASGGDGVDKEKELDTQMQRLLNAVDPHALCCQPWVRASATHSLALLHAGNDRGMSANMGFEFGVVIKADEKGAGLW